MRIEELVLEGFKSYPVRTQITGWDPSFNAITGLNGSGKSNILDAICFVLGITDVKQMRAQNLQELIYKRGQAGITKASVTIVFDNSDRENSPVGLENCKQITVTRQIALPNVSKYLLNGHKSQMHTIQTMFQGVQLNINNPNFVIMQGRITKVLNMRPQEVLGMVEEAAGTRMFEERKEKAKKTMDKKEKRVAEIEGLLREEITPKLDGLRAEKRSFLSYQKACTELERLARLLRAWDWREATERVRRKEVDIERRAREVHRVQGVRDARARECDAAERDLREAEKRRDAELKKGGQFAKREEEAKALEKELVKLRTQVENWQGSIKDENANVSKLEIETGEVAAALKQKQEEVSRLTESYDACKTVHTQMQTTLSTHEDLLQSLLTGLSSNSSNNATGGGGYLGQLADAKARLAQEAATEEQIRRRLALSEKELSGLLERWRTVEEEAGDAQKGLDAARADLMKVRTRLVATGWTAEKDAVADAEFRAAKDNVRAMTEQRDALRQRLGSLDFQYADPVPGFDRSTVKGLVATLLTLPSGNRARATALEVSAGTRLYNVVVADEHVGTLLLQHGRLRSRVTLIPLNKISATRVPATRLAAARRAGAGRAHPAVELVGCAEEVERAIAYVFGDTIICDDTDAAKAVAFTQGSALKSVTLEGDVYDPSGTLSGGSAPSGNGVLLRVQELREAENRLIEAEDELFRIEQAALQGRKTRDAWKELSRKLEIKEHEAKLLEEQVGGSNAARVGEEVAALKRSIEELNAAVKEARKAQADATADCGRLEQDMEDFKNNKEGKIRELKAQISTDKSALQRQAVVVKTHQKELQTATLELEQLQTDITAGQRALADARASVEKVRKELLKLTKEVAAVETEHREAERKLQEERATLTRFDSEVVELERVIKEKRAEVADAELMLKKFDHEMQNLKKDQVASGKHIADLEKLHDWIPEEKANFGKPGTAYDFDAYDIPAEKEKFRELEGQQKGLKKKINPRVMNMIDDVEKKELSLKKMLATVLRDKSKIEDTIVELDRYKRDALQRTWEKVNGDFGDIFAELLPGNFAKLQPLEDRDLMDGLEVKVQLGSVWKQSLTELSGGQRSLIALSLIMALLQFKPAPMYILDEIDAALDLSHTQHIGQLFRTRFRGSQFIVVSLKEGLFTNANVLFRARFRDGTSVVERTAQRSGSSLYAEGEAAGAGVKKRGTRVSAGS